MKEYLALNHFFWASSTNDVTFSRRDVCNNRVELFEGGNPRKFLVRIPATVAVADLLGHVVEVETVIRTFIVSSVDVLEKQLQSKSVVTITVITTNSRTNNAKNSYNCFAPYGLFAA